MGNTLQPNKARRLVGIVALFALFCTVPSCSREAAPEEYAFFAGEDVVVETGLESGAVAFLSLADMKKWVECSEKGDIDGQRRVESICTSLGGGCRLRDGVRGEVHQVEGEYVRVIVGARLWWVQDYALKRAD